MNKCYRLVFNRCSRVWQAVAENARGHGRGGYKLMAATALATTLPFAHAAGTAELIDLGVLGTTTSYAYAISRDGSTIVGISNDSNGDRHAFVWDADNNMSDLGVLSTTNGTTSEANGVNGDGTVIVGQTAVTVGSNDYTQAFRWTPTGGMVSLGTLVSSGSTVTALASRATAVNGDGTIVVGSSVNDDGQNHAFRWIEDSASTHASGGDMTQLFTAVGTNIVNFSEATAINKAGDVIVGTYESSSVERAFRWTDADGAQNLGGLDEAVNTSWASWGTGVNDAGDVVVGMSTQTVNGNEHREAFRWTAAAGMVGLGVLDGYTHSGANAVNADGNVIVGTSSDNNVGSKAFRWEAGSGIQSIEDWLTASGIDTSNLVETATSAFGVSGDGTIVVGSLDNGHAYLARGESGLIDVAGFYNSLTRTAASAVLAENQNDLVFHGMHGNPMQMLLKTGGSGFWLSGDLGRQERDARKSDMVIGEIGYGHRINDTVQFNISAGHTYSKADTDVGGKTRVNSNFILPEVIVSLPGSLYATVSGMYAKGSAKIDRGYINTGTATLSKGSPDTTTLGARIRLDWHEMANVGGVMLTPYIGFSYLQTTIDAYNETGGGFPVSWNKREEKATTARLGLDASKLVGETLKFTGRLEGVHRFEDKNVGASGQSVGLGEFNFAGQKLKQNWLRAGAGLEGKLGSGIASATLNATTEGEAAAYWLAVNYRWQF